MLLTKREGFDWIVTIARNEGMRQMYGSRIKAARNLYDSDTLIYNTFTYYIHEKRGSLKDPNHPDQPSMSPLLFLWYPHRFRLLVPPSPLNLLILNVSFDFIRPENTLPQLFESPRTMNISHLSPGVLRRPFPSIRFAGMRSKYEGTALFRNEDFNSFDQLFLFAFEE
jgi:hypothetical protein